MKRFLPIVMFLMTGAMVAPAAKADLTHRMTSSTQLSVNGAYTDAQRIGSTYSVSGSNIKVASADDHFGKLLAPSNNAAGVSRTPSITITFRDNVYFDQSGSSMTSWTRSYNTSAPCSGFTYNLSLIHI